MKISPLGYILLGLCTAEPRSGYALRKVFAETPMGQYSSSPGSIYPALNALQRDGLLEPAPGAAARYQPTRLGLDAFHAWLKQPLTAEDVSRNWGIAILRFAFLDMLADPVVSMRFLDSLADALAESIAPIREFLDREGATMPPHARLAVESGLTGLQAQARWASAAHAELSRRTRIAS